MLILVLGFIGSLVDPFTFQPRPTQEQLGNLKVISSILPSSSIVHFTSINEMYHLFPALDLWARVADKTVMLARYKPTGTYYIITTKETTIVKNSEEILYNSPFVKVFLVPTGIT